LRHAAAYIQTHADAYDIDIGDDMAAPDAVEFTANGTMPEEGSAPLDIDADSVWSEDGPSESLQATEQRFEAPSALSYAGVAGGGGGRLDFTERDGNLEATLRDEPSLRDHLTEQLTVDIVDSVIEQNKAKFRTSNNVSFSLLDATRDQLPTDYDLILCREVLFHLSFDDCRRVVQNVKSTNARYLLATTTAGLEVNKDIVSGGFRNLNLEIAPFCFPMSDYRLKDDWVSSARVLALWRVSELPNL